MTTTSLNASTTALVVVDIQPEFWSMNKSVPKETFCDFEKSNSAILKTCREANAFVAHIRTNYTEELSPWCPEFSRLNPDKKAILPFDPVNFKSESFSSPIGDELVIGKNFFGACQNTKLV